MDAFMKKNKNKNKNKMVCFLRNLGRFETHQDYSVAREEPTNDFSCSRTFVEQLVCGSAFQIQWTRVLVPTSFFSRALLVSHRRRFSLWTFLRCDSYASPLFSLISSTCFCSSFRWLSTRPTIEFLTQTPTWRIPFLTWVFFSFVDRVFAILV